MRREPLLVEIGCEEIPARMIRRAAADLGASVEELLDRAGLEHGPRTEWSGPRRLAVRVESVDERQADRDEELLGPPAAAAFGADGAPTRAALGFAAKHGVDPARLERRRTERGDYVGFTRRVTGRTVGEILAEGLPSAVEGMAFPKNMRWGDGTRRWVRPVHWVVALHGERALPLELFGVTAGNASLGHRFLAAGPVVIPHADRYATALEAASVIVDPVERRRRLAAGLERAARELGGAPVPDPELLDEAADLVEWPGTVGGEFDARFLELPRELLVTTLRHHQKCFSVQDPQGGLRPAFVAVANTDRDARGHVRRGNEWVIGGRLEDARFFWGEDSKVPLVRRAGELAGVVFHAQLGSYADKARRTVEIAERLASHLALDPAAREHCREAAALAKVDLVTDTVGEFPELQGQMGGLLLAAAGASEAVARGVYEHYRPVTAEDDPPSTLVGSVISIADRLDTIVSMIGAGETPTGSRDPLGLRRASSAVFRVVLARDWPVSARDLARLGGAADGEVLVFLLERLRNFLRDAGYTPNEIQAVFRPNVGPEEGLVWPLGDILQRLEAIRTVRARRDFAQLADLTKRVDNILAKGEAVFAKAAREAGRAGHHETSAAVTALEALVEEHGGTMGRLEVERRYTEAVDLLATFVQPVERFFDEVLVLDPDQPEATLHRRELLGRLRVVLTRCFDVRELAGQAERRPT